MAFPGDSPPMGGTEQSHPVAGRSITALPRPWSGLSDGATLPPASNAPALSNLSLWAAAVLAVDAAAVGGLRLRGAAGPQRDAWLAALRGLWPADRPWLRLPLSITDDRLIGGLDLVATLAQGRSVAQRGLLADADGGLVVVCMAERLPARVAAQLAGAIDRGEVLVEREGFAARHAARIGVLALDEAEADDAPLAGALAERLGLAIDLALELAAGPAGETSGAAQPESSVPQACEPWPVPPDAADVASARLRWRQVAVAEPELETLCAAAAALGVESLRRSCLALNVMRIVAALAGHGVAGAGDLQLALALVVVPWATRVPALANAETEPEQSAAEPEPPPPPDAPPPIDNPAEPAAEPAVRSQDLDERVETLVAAALASLPPGLLATLAAQASRHAARHAREGRSGALAISKLRGRPLAARPGDPRQGYRLSVIDTLRAAAPWQRRRQAAPGAVPAGAARLQLRRDDLRVVRRAQRRGSTTVFVIDASGSAALHRLAEAKGAVELLLAESYVRRDEVAVIAFRGANAQVVLPPTRSLVRAKRALAGLPGGGGTPLAAALDAARELAEQVARRGATPSIVLLSDGRANVPRDVPRTKPGGPTAGRAVAEADAMAAAGALAAGAVKCLVIDTSPQPGLHAQRIATQMRAHYLPLPHARADAVSAAARGLRERSSR